MKPDALRTVEIIHPFNKELRTLPVEDIARTYVALRWPLSGIYDLNLKSNTLTARSQKAQRKGRCLWMAVDIELVRRMVRIHFDGVDEKQETKERIVRHALSMPRAAVIDARSVYPDAAAHTHTWQERCKAPCPRFTIVGPETLADILARSMGGNAND